MVTIVVKLDTIREMVDNFDTNHNLVKLETTYASGITLEVNRR